MGTTFENQVRANNQFNETPNAVWTINNPQLKVYPNPAHSKLIISGTTNGANKGKVTIYTLDGKKCYDSSYEVVFPHEIDLSSYNSGIYFINVRRSDKNFIKKIVIK